MERSVIVYGPPGSGKTTLVRYMRDHDPDQHWRYLDLEDVPFSIRNEVARAALGDPRHPYVIGAANLSPAFPVNRNTVKVLLTLSDEIYVLRRAERDRIVSAERDQPHHSMQAWRALKGLVPVDATPFIPYVASDVWALVGRRFADG